MKKAIFLDRDGVLNVFKRFISKANDIVLEEDAAKAVALINKSGYLAIVITNQPVIAAGQASWEEIENIHQRLKELMGQENAIIDDIFVCPHFPEKGYAGEVEELKIKCKCRKPSPGLIYEACAQYNIDLKGSWMIGDMTSDIMAGINAGCKTALVLTGFAGKDKKFDVLPDVAAKNLLEAVEAILAEESKANEY